MANLLPKDEELFNQIVRENIQVDPVLWNVIYQYIGDAIIVINLMVRYYIDHNEIIPKDEAKKILIFTKRLVEIIKKLDHPENIPPDEKDSLFKTIKEKSLKLDKVTDELFGNYVRNDINIINVIVGNYIDPLDESEGISVEDGRRILEHTRSTMRFMDKLRIATSKKEAY
jgi:hypothetical protein